MKRFFFALVFVLALGAVQAQTTENSVSQLDAVIKNLAGVLHQRLGVEKAQKVSIGQFVFQDGLPSLSSYWNTQLTQELAAVLGRSWILLSGPGADADFTISGEIVEIVSTVRVFTRIIRSRDRSIVTGIQSDFTRDAFIAEMLADGGSRSDSGSGGRSISRDAYEPDSMENPITTEIGVSEGSARVMNRTIHGSGDEDFFLLAPDSDGNLTVETTGSMDTIMDLYDSEGSQLADNDDGGSGGNARIRHSVRAGSRYIARVRGYSGETGSYGFRAYIAAEVRITPDEFEEDNNFSTAKELSIGTPQQHTFHNSGDVDYVKFTVSREAVYTLRARGVNSNRLDTYIELFDSQQRSIEEDDDGGDNLDSLIERRLTPGTYYLKVECVSDSPDQPYTVSVSAGE